jgi:hypothetical protein
VRVDVENVSNDSTVETLWALGALEPKKRLKRPDVRVGLWWKGCRKQLPKAPFSAVTRDHLLSNTYSATTPTYVSVA